MRPGPQAYVRVSTATQRPRHHAFRLQLLLAPFAVLTALAAAQGGDPSGVRIAVTEAIGEHVTDAAGYSLYLFWPDSQGVSLCTDACALAWPPMSVAAADALPIVAEGVAAALLGVIQRSDGTFQVTFNGWPLYYYVGDSRPGDNYGHMATEDWYLITPTGAPLGLGAGG